MSSSNNTNDPNTQNPSYMDTARNAVNSMTGNTSDSQGQNENNKNENNKNENDKVTLAFLPRSFVPFQSNKRQLILMMHLQPDQPSGKYNQTVGSAKQSIGTLVGNKNLQRTGEEQNQQGQDEEAQIHAQNWAEGVEKRAKGKVGAVLAAGQPEGGGEDDHMKWKRLHDEGKQTQKGAEQDIDKRWGK